MLKEILIYISFYVGLFIVAYYFLSLILDKKTVKKFSENELPKVSIIIPAYNEEKVIKETIHSALELNYPKSKIEIFVVVNGSRDKTYENAKSIKDERLRIFNLKEGGKANAINFALTKVKGEIIVTMNADSIAEPSALREMVNYFTNPDVMCVAPSMAVYNPKGILQRVQQIEYFMGVYLRRAFSSMQAIHITPGAFSSYRKKFFDKYGGFQVGNITEDMEVSLRIQYNHYLIELADKAVVYTRSPNKFLPLLKQRRRWYFGLVKNLLQYRKIFSRKYGELGMIVLPASIITIFFSIVLTSWTVIDTIKNIIKEINFLEGINFDFSNIILLNKFVFERFFFSIFSNPVFLFLIFFILVLVSYMIFSKTRVFKYSSIKLSFPIFLAFFSLLFAFWWVVSLFYLIFVGKISWGRQ